MAGRTHFKHMRVYAGGYELSGYVLDPGPFGVEFDAEPIATLTDAIKGALPGQAAYMLGPLNGVLDNTATSGMHVLHATPGSKHIVTVAIGDRAAPAAGVPTFTGEFYQKTYMADVPGPVVPATIEFTSSAVDGETLAYDNPWGNLLHANAAETAANEGTADHDNGAASTAGGLGYLHVLAGNGTCTFSIQHSATNTDAAFDAAGAIITFDTTAAATPFSEVKATATQTTTINQYTRWQIVLGTATTVTFVMGLMRG